MHPRTSSGRATDGTPMLRQSNVDPTRLRNTSWSSPYPISTTVRLVPADGSSEHTSVPGSLQGGALRHVRATSQPVPTSPLVLRTLLIARVGLAVGLALAGSGTVMAQAPPGSSPTAPAPLGSPPSPVANQPLTRVQFAQDLVTGLKATETSHGPYFQDVPKGLQQWDAIETATGMNWMSGVSTFQFAPNRPVTRLEEAQALVAALGLTFAAQQMTGVPEVSDASQIPAQDDGIVGVALSLGLVPAVNGAFDPGGTVTASQLKTNLATEQAVTPAQIGTVTAPLAQSLWVGIPWYAPTQSQDLTPGGTVQLADEISDGELVLPGPVTYTASCGTLESNFNTLGGKYDQIFTAPNRPSSCTVTGTIPGTSLSASVTLNAYQSNALGFPSSTPQMTTVGQKLDLSGEVLSPNPTGSAGELVDAADAGTALSLSVTSPTSATTVLSSTDQAGVATFAWTPTTVGTYTFTLSAPSDSANLPSVSAQIEVTASPALTAQGMLGASTLTYPGSTSLSLGLTPDSASAGTDIPSQVPVRVTVQSANGSVNLSQTVASVSLAAAEATGGTPVVTVDAGQTPGSDVLTITSPEDLFAPVTEDVTVNPSGTMTVTVPSSAQPAGSDVSLSATLTGAPAGTTVSFTPTAPDGETGLLSTKSEVNSATAQTNASGVATASLPDQYMSGTYQVQVDAPGYAQVTSDYTIDPGTAVAMEAVLAPSPFIRAGASAAVSVSPVDQYGNPVPGVTVPVQVHLMGPDGRYTSSAQSVTGEGTVGTIQAGSQPGKMTLVVSTPTFHHETLRLPVSVIVNPLQLIKGKGTWLTYGAWAALGTKAIIRQMKAQGMQYVYLETAASCCNFYGQLPLDRFVDAAHDAGIAVITWNYDALTNLRADEASAQQALAYRTRLGSGTDGFTADLEQNLSANAVGSFSQYVRGLLGPDGLYVATIYPPQNRFNTPLKVLSQYVNAFAPMDYWHGLAEEYTYTQVYQYIENSIHELEASVPDVPIQVIAETYDIYDNGSGPAEGIYSPTGYEEEAAIMAATQFGAQSISFYNLHTETSAEGQVIGSMPPVHVGGSRRAHRTPPGPGLHLAGGGPIRTRGGADGADRALTPVGQRGQVSR